MHEKERLLGDRERSEAHEEVHKGEEGSALTLGDGGGRRNGWLVMKVRLSKEE